MTNLAKSHAVLTDLQEQKAKQEAAISCAAVFMAFTSNELRNASQLLQRTEDEREHFRRALFTSLDDTQQTQQSASLMEYERSQLVTQLVQSGLVYHPKCKSVE